MQPVVIFDVYDSLGYTNTVEKMRRFAKETHSQVLFDHDSEQFKQFRKSVQGYYE